MPKWLTRATGMLQSKTAVQTAHGNARLAISGEPAAAELDSGDQRRRPARPNALSRTISNGRRRLDRALIRSDPSDPNPTAEIQTYRFGLALLLKSPSFSLKSTRGPSQFKRISRSTQNHSQNPLIFQELEPTVQPCCFSALTPAAIV